VVDVIINWRSGGGVIGTFQKKVGKLPVIEVFQPEFGNNAYGKMKRMMATVYCLYNCTASLNAS
jgi:hypothetical protein